MRNKVKNMVQKFAKAKFYLFLGIICSLPGYTQASELSLSNLPLFLSDGVPPNIIFNMDDSGSMAWAEIFDSGISCGFTDKCYTSPDVNKLYYNPNLTYIPPVKEDGSSYPNADFYKAWINGYNPSLGKKNLSKKYKVTTDLYMNSQYTVGTEKAAYYYRFDSSNPGCPGTPITDFTSNAANKCFDKVVVSKTSGPGGIDERQNFANWYSYYRTRLLTTKTAALRAFAKLGDRTRVGWIALNSTQKISSGNKNYVSAFGGNHRENFFDWVASRVPSGYTPLRRAVKRVGDYMMTTDKYNPYAEEPGVKKGVQLSCRQSFQVIFSDGQWNSDSGISGNIDNTGTTLPDGKVYNPGAPYKDNNSSFLADNTFYYWKTDLQPNIDNNVPPYFRVKTNNSINDYWNPANDPATWQHLVNFVITMGVNGKRTYPDDYDDLVAGALSWGSNHIDDAWHAAINSRGEYFSAKDTQELVDTFQIVLNRVADREASGSGVAVNSAQLSTLDRLYSARFSSDFWTGNMVVTEVNSGVLGVTIYDAGCILTGGSCPADGKTYTPHDPDSRRIVTSNGSGAGIPFRESSLNSTQLAALNKNANGTVDNEATDRIKFLRGDRSRESGNPGGIFRARHSILGDIVHSSPRLVNQPFVTFPNKGTWQDLLHPSTTVPENDGAAQSFDSFTTTISGRKHMLYIGANDGMLHAFNAANGKEEFAYIPNVLFPKLTKLSYPAYVHDYFVDGSPVSAEAFFDNAWHTVLVGNLRTGGQAVYALDITSAPAPGDDETDIAKKVMWEFTHPDLGYGYGEPEIVRLHNGKWAAIFGNGYNNTKADGSVSTTGTASLFIVDIKDGTLIRKIDTGVGDTSTPNGIGSTLSYDADGDFIVDYVYGGDLQGNFWKFDLRSTNTGEWKVAYANTSTSPTELRPLAKAVDKNGNPQAITGRPTVFAHPEGGHMVIFGTGKYLESGDASLDTSKLNSVYGIWDRDENPVGYTYDQYRVFAPLGRNNSAQPLAVRTSTETLSSSGLPVRTVEGSQIDWTGSNMKYGWYMDFPAGELQFTPLSKFNNLVILSNFKPDDDSCAFGGDSWLYAFNYLQGRSEGVTFDTNKDGEFDNNDNVTLADGAGGTYTASIGAVKLSAATVAASLVIDAGTYTNVNTSTVYDKAVVGTSSVDTSFEQIDIIDPNTGTNTGGPGSLSGRMNWRQIK